MCVPRPREPVPGGVWDSLLKGAYQPKISPIPTPSCAGRPSTSILNQKYGTLGLPAEKCRSTEDTSYGSTVSSTKNEYKVVAHYGHSDIRTNALENGVVVLVPPLLYVIKC